MRWTVSADTSFPLIVDHGVSSQHGPGGEGVSSTELRLAVSVEDGAEVRVRDVTVENPGGTRSTASAVLSILAGPGGPGGGEDADDSDSSGNGGPACRRAQGPVPGWPWLRWVRLVWGVSRRLR
jgi:hypothetical protein